MITGVIRHGRSAGHVAWLSRPVITETQARNGGPHFQMRKSRLGVKATWTAMRGPFLMMARLPPDGLAGEGPGPEGGSLWKELSTYSRPPGAHLLRAGPRIGHCTGCSLSSKRGGVLVCTGHCTEVGGRGTDIWIQDLKLQCLHAPGRKYKCTRH